LPSSLLFHHFLFHSRFSFPIVFSIVFSIVFFVLFFFFLLFFFFFTIMKATTLVAILSSFHSSVHATVTTSDNDVILHRRESTQSLIDSYAGQGLCLSYAAEQNREAMLAPCKIWCPKQSPENDPEAVGVCTFWSVSVSC